MKKKPTQHIRFAIILVLVLGSAIITRAYLLPASLIDHPMQIQATLDREKAKTISYAGAIACKECHDDQYKIKQGGYHKNLSCESCHGPGATHAGNPTENAMKKPKGRDYCFVCHSYSLSKPTGFPQVDPIQHNPMKPCVECHNPHDPKPPETPHQCEACHQGIHMTKSMSPHAKVDCIECHETPEAHKLTPRLVHPTKPSTREFCGKCHAKNAERKDTPKIDLDTHGQKYLCWQCHYPHMPEVQ